MKVADLLETRRENWRELESLCDKLASRRLRSQAAPLVARFAALYRAACADLALSDAYQLPPNTVQYLHQLVGRAHNQLYRSRGFHFTDWGREMLLRVPRRLLHDRALWLAFCLFYGTFLAAAFCAYVSPKFTEAAIGREMIAEIWKKCTRSHSRVATPTRPASWGACTCCTTPASACSALPPACCWVSRVCSSPSPTR